MVGNLIETLKSTGTDSSKSNKITLNAANQVVAVSQTGHAPMTVKYSKKGNPLSVKKGGDRFSYEFDQLGRLTAVNDSERGQSEYAYQADEADIRHQFDRRTKPVRSQQTQVTGHNQTQNQLLYARMSGSPWQAVIFDAKLGKLLVPSPGKTSAPDAGFQSSKQRRRLYDAKSTLKQQQRNFDKPSSSHAQPNEYTAINCNVDPYLECILHGVLIDEIAPPTVGTQVTLSAFGAGGFDCIPNYTFIVDGVIQGYNNYGLLPFTFDKPGSHSVKVIGECACGNHIQWAATTIHASCPVGDGLTANDGCLSVTTETVATSTAANSRKTIGVGEVVNLVASKDSQWELIGEGTISTTKGNTIEFIAGEKASKPKVKVTSGPDTVTIEFNVIIPSALIMKKELNTCLLHTKGVAGTGMRAQVYAAPDSVSFANIKIYEPWDIGVQGKGIGYFEYLTGFPHIPGDELNSDGLHLEGINGVTPGLGTNFTKYDHPIMQTDPARTPYSDGYFYWDIPWHYQVKETSNNYLIKKLRQEHNINDVGAVDAIKGGHTEASQLMDETTTWFDKTCP